MIDVSISLCKTYDTYTLSKNLTDKIYFKINACIKNIFIKQLVNLYCHNY